MASLALTAPLKQRIAHTDPTKFRSLSGPHAGAGTMDFGSLYETNALSNNLIFLHRGVIAPHSGIGQHFHNQCEEMFVILDGEAQFTIDGRTSLIKGPAAVPDRMGHSHAIYNPTEKSIQWMNVNVGITKIYDAWDMGDSCANASLDPVPQFINVRFDHALLKPVERMDGGEGVVHYRRALNPTIFSTPWAYVDHLLIPPGASVGSRALANLTELYYIMSGDGEVTVDGESEAITAGNAIPIDLNQSRALSSGKEPLEAMVIGIAKDMEAKAFMMADASIAFRN